jgi:hypothetical protein
MGKKGGSSSDYYNIVYCPFNTWNYVDKDIKSKEPLGRLTLIECPILRYVI